MDEWHIEGRDIFIENWGDNGMRIMSVEEAIRRLNATEALSAEDARVIAQAHEGKTKTMLKAYADILEGK